MLYEDQEMYHKQKSVNQVLSEWKIKQLRMWNEMGENQIDYQQSKSVFGQSQEEYYICLSRSFIDMTEVGW